MGFIEGVFWTVCILDHRIICFSIDFAVYRVHDCSKILLKSISERQINPLITKNRFTVFFPLPTWFGLFKQNPNKCTFISTIQIFHMFPLNFLFRSILHCKATETYFGGNSIFHLKWCKGTTRISHWLSSWKWVMTFHRISLLLCLSKCWNNSTPNSTYIPVLPSQTRL